MVGLTWLILTYKGCKENIMAKLTTKARNALPTSAFAGPGRTYPVEDKAHAKAAIMLNGAGALTSDQQKSVTNKAKKVIRTKPL